MVFPPISFRWLKQKKMRRVKVVCLEVDFHPSNLLPSLKKLPVYKKRPVSFWTSILKIG